MSTSDYMPPYSVSEKAVDLLARICEILGRVSVQQTPQALRLRRVNRIRTIQGSLAIEGNTLTEEEITAVMEGKPVIASPQEVQEVRNAIKVYEKMSAWNPFDPNHLLEAHVLLMGGLTDRIGAYRQTGAGVMGKEGLVHIAPPADRVPFQMKELFQWLEQTDAHPLISSSVFHYEFEFIHPFEDGNGRMGRLWQTMILARWNSLFADLPVESLVHAHQSGYYNALNLSTEKADCAPFIEFMLEVILETLLTTQETAQETTQENRADQIVEILRRNPQATRQAIADALGDISADGVKYHLKKLQDAGRLKRMGSTKAGRWEVQ